MPTFTMLPTPARRLVWVLAALGLLPLAACTDDDGDGLIDPETTDDLLDPDAPPVTEWDGWRPAVGLTWSWQLQGEVPVDRAVDVYDIDLFDTPEALFLALRGRGVRTICYLSAGSWEDWRDDAASFPAEVRGRPLDGWPGERWLDIRSPQVLNSMSARLRHARDRGCDGVELDNVTAWANDSGFPLSRRDQLAYNRALANEAHRLGLAVALKNAGALVPELVDWFDLEINEECFAYDECYELMPFVTAGKPVLNAEYAETEAAAHATASQICEAAAERSFATVIFPLELDGSWEVACPRPT